MAVNKAKLVSGYDKLYFRREDLIPYLREKEIRASSIYCDSLSSGLTPKEIAIDAHISLASVNQAIGWCKKNKDLVGRVLHEERIKAGIKD